MPSTFQGKRFGQTSDLKAQNSSDEAKKTLEGDICLFDGPSHKNDAELAKHARLVISNHKHEKLTNIQKIYNLDNRLSTAKSEDMVLNQRKVDCPLWVGGVHLPRWRSLNIMESC